MAGKIGRICEFDESIELWSSYQERLEQYYLANDVKDEKKVPVLLSVVGGRTYSILRDLVAPDVPGTKEYKNLVDTLKAHFNPTPIQIAERFRFHKRDQKEGESIRDFNASIRKLSEHCGFTDLNDSLKDRLVCGLRNEQIQKRLLTEKVLTYATALETAVAMETAARDAIELRKHQSHNVHKVQHVKTKGPKTPKATQKVCYRCNGTNHTSDECHYKNEICHKCDKKGHIQRACRAEQFKKKKKKHAGNKVHAIDESSDEDFLGKLDTIDVHSVHENPYWIKPEIDGVQIKMELDTGSAVSILPTSVYKKHYTKTLEDSDMTLRSYSGEHITPKGKMDVEVQTNGQKAVLSMYVVDSKGPPLFGRDWLHALKLDWPEIRRCHYTSEEMTLESVKAKFPNVFKDELGTVKGIEAQIKVKPDATPKFCKARPVPYAIRPKVEKELDRLVETGILTKVETSDWATPIVPVMKKDGSVRICGDFKITVNQVLDVDQYPLPKVEDIFSSLAGGEKFSKLDLKSAYLQMVVRPEDRKYLTINSLKGLFQYNRLVFGIASAPAIWQRTIEQILQGLSGVGTILDDMIVTWKNDREHLKNLEKVLERMDRYGLRLNNDKCAFFQESLTFCGHRIDATGIHKTEDKVQAVQEAAAPENVSQLRAFLGLVNYYARFLPHLATVLRPLHHLLEKGVPWTWDKNCQEAFGKVKEMMTSDNVLVHYDPELPVLVSCDASPYGLGAVLSHKFPNGDERPIAYASRTLTSAEKNYSQIDKEALGIVWGVKRFHTYLYGREFLLVTDHQPLTSIFSPAKGIPATSAARLQRYALFLSGFQYKIHFKGTKSHGNADGLSRLPRVQSEQSDDYDVDGTFVFINEQFETLPVTCKEVRQATAKDPILSRVYDMVMHGWHDGDDSELSPYRNRSNELSVHQGCLLWGMRVVIPQKLQKRVLDEVHEGHLGVVKMKGLCRSFIWWPGIDQELEMLAKSCEGCQRHKVSPNTAPIHPWEWPARPWQRVHADFAGPFEGSMFLLIVDAHSKWPEIVQMSTTTASKTIEVMREVFSRNGLPETLVTDNGPQLVSEEFERFMKRNGIRHTTSAPYHPRTNGLAERLVFTFKQAMKASRKSGGSVNQRLSNFLLAYRSSPHSTTNETPAALFMGRVLQTRLSLLKPSVEKRVSKEQEKMFADSKRPARSFTDGDQVCVRDYRANGDKWVAGTVLSQSGPLSYKVDVGPGSVWRRHADQILQGTLPTPDPQPEVSLVPPTKTVPAATASSGCTPSHQPTTAERGIPPSPRQTNASPAPRRYPARSNRNKPPQRLDL